MKALGQHLRGPGLGTSHSRKGLGEVFTLSLRVTETCVLPRAHL